MTRIARRGTHRARTARTALAALVSLALIGGAAGCAGSSSEPAETEAPPQTTETELTGELTIFAAASLSGAFDELARDFGELHPDLTVLPISYDGSSVLATQLVEGAPADVFASADEPNMATVVDDSLAEGSDLFATNVLQIAVAPGNPHGIETLADLTGSDLTVVLCAAEVPCGNASRTLLENASVELTPASEEQNVTAVLAKVKSGEADAGLVYRTDVTAADGEVDGIDIDGTEEATNLYPITALSGAANPEAAAAFVEFVLSDAGREVLEDYGFGAP